MFKSIDNGVTWTQPDPTGRLETRPIRAIVISDTGTLYAGADNSVAASSGVFQSIDGGISWIPIGTAAKGLSNRKVQSLVVDGATLYAGTHEEAGVPGGVFKWNGTTWTQINNGLPNQSARRVQALAVDKRTGGGIYAGTEGEGVFKTFDGGANWLRVDNPACQTRGSSLTASSRPRSWLCRSMSPSRLHRGRRTRRCMRGRPGPLVDGELRCARRPRSRLLQVLPGQPPRVRGVGSQDERGLSGLGADDVEHAGVGNRDETPTVQPSTPHDLHRHRPRRVHERRPGRELGRCSGDRAARRPHRLAHPCAGDTTRPQG